MCLRYCSPVVKSTNLPSSVELLLKRGTRTPSPNKKGRPRVEQLCRQKGSSMQYCAARQQGRSKDLILSPNPNSNHPRCFHHLHLPPTVASRQKAITVTWCYTLASFRPSNSILLLVCIHNKSCLPEKWQSRRLMVIPSSWNLSMRN